MIQEVGNDLPEKKNALGGLMLVWFGWLMLVWLVDVGLVG